MTVPISCTYAAVQIDPTATISGVTDPDVLAAAQKIRPAKCLLLLHWITQLPMPELDTFVYEVCLVGPGTRKSGEHITSDMCIPIFPAAQHPAGRHPVHAQPAFPFSNCYHWFGPEMMFSLRVKTAQFPSESTAVIRLPHDQAMIMEEALSDDMDRWAESFARSQEESAQPVASSSAGVPDGQPAPVGDHDHEYPDGGAAPHKPSQRSPTEPGDSSSISSSTSYGTRWSEMPSERDIEEMDFLDVLDNKHSCLPVVDVWLDLNESLEEQHIPDPTEFAEQYQLLYDLLKQHKEAEWNKRRLEHRLAKERAASEYSAKEAESGRHGSSQLSTYQISKVRKFAYTLLGGVRSFFCLGGPKISH